MGNVVLFGHSSYLPVVGNQAYKTFNGIQKLVAGDMITVYSSGTTYTYRVRAPPKRKQTILPAIPLSIAGKVLTLVTCNPLRRKEDRFVVTADFVESHLGFPIRRKRRISSPQGERKQFFRFINQPLARHSRKGEADE